MKKTNYPLVQSFEVEDSFRLFVGIQDSMKFGLIPYVPTKDLVNIALLQTCTRLNFVHT